MKVSGVPATVPCRQRGTPNCTHSCRVFAQGLRRVEIWQICSQKLRKIALPTEKVLNIKFEVTVSFQQQFLTQDFHQHVPYRTFMDMQKQFTHLLELLLTKF